MVDELRGRMAAYLSEHRVCVISTSGARDAWAMPVPYRNRSLEVDCLLPRWADAIYHLEQNSQVLLIIHDPPLSPLSGGSGGGLRWLQYRGTAQPIASPDWDRLLPEGASNVRPEERYAAMRVTPERIDLIDEGRGWGARETLDL